MSTLAERMQAAAHTYRGADAAGYWQHIADAVSDPDPIALRDALRIHHPTMRSETGPFSGCRCGAVRLGEDVIAHVVAELSAALRGNPK